MYRLQMSRLDVTIATPLEGGSGSDAAVAELADRLDGGVQDLSGGEVGGRVHAVSHARRGAGEEQVAGLEGDELAHVGHEVGGGEHQLRGAGGLADHAVDVATDGQIGSGS